MKILVNCLNKQNNLFKLLLKKCKNGRIRSEE